MNIIEIFNIEKSVMSTVSLEDPVNDISIELPATSGTLLTVDQLETNISKASSVIIGNIFYIEKPVITNPLDNTLSFYGTVKASPYAQTSKFTGEHTETDWEFSTSSDFSVSDKYYKDPVNLTSFSFIPSYPNIRYYGRVRYRSNNTLSDWSDTITFTSATGYPNKPIVSIVNDKNNGGITPNIVVSPFSIVDGDDELTAMDYEVSTTNTFSNIVFSSYTDVTNLTGIQLGNMKPGTMYYIRVKQYGLKYETPWSDSLTYLTKSKTDTPILNSPTTGVETTTINVIIENYISSNSYSVSTNGGTYVREDNVIKWTLPTVDILTDYRLTVYSKDLVAGLPISELAYVNVTVSNLPVTSDQGIIFNTSNIVSSFGSSFFKENPKLQVLHSNNSLTNKGLSTARGYNLLYSSPLNTVNSLAYNKDIYTPKHNDRFISSNDEYLTINNINTVTNVITFNETMSSVPEGIFLLETELVSEPITQEEGETDFTGITTLRGIEFSKNVIDNSNTSTLDKIYYDDRKIEINVGQQFVTDTNEIFTVGISNNDGIVADIPKIRKIVGIFHGYVAIKDNGELWGIGNNTYGQFGLGHNNTLTEWTYLNIKVKDVAGYDFLLAIDENDNLIGSGNNKFGVLGQGNLISSNVWLETGLKVKSVKAGATHAIAITTNDLLYVIGDNTYGQLGLNNNVSKTKWTLCSPSTDVYTIATEIACSNHSSFVKIADGTIYSTGYNYHGTLGLGNNANALKFTNTNVKCKNMYISNGETSYIIRDDNMLLGCGRNTYGQLGNNTTLNVNVFTELGIFASYVISYGSSAYVKRLNNDEWLVAGYNADNRLGVEDTNNITAWTQLPGEYSLCAASDTSCLLVDVDNKLYGSGVNNYYQLGTLNSGNLSKLTRIPTYKPFTGKYHPNSWIVPTNTLNNPVKRLYPLSNIYFNNVKVNVKQAVIVEDTINTFMDDVEFNNSRTLITKLSVPYCNSFYALSGNLNKLV